MTIDIPHDLVEQFARGNGVVFVGAGLSQGARVPGWSELLAPLAASIGVPANTDPLRIAQYYEIKRGRQALVSHLTEQTDTTDKQPTENHRRLLRLGAHTWVTTNYDDLIERALREAGERCTKVVRDQDLPYTSADAVALVKLHGDRERPDTVVITQQDYNTYFRRFPRIKDKLTGLLLEKTFLFVGYSVSDPDFNQIQAEIAFDLQQHQRMAYAALFDADEFTISDLRSRSIHVLNIPMDGQANYSERLGELLDDLIRQVDQARQQRAQTACPTVVTSASTPTEDVRGLLEAMGYRITDTKVIGSDLYFLCDAKWGAEIRQELVHFVGGQPQPSAIAALNDAVTSHNAARGVLLTRQPLPDSLCNLARQRESIQCYTLDEFTDRLADFRPYLERLVQEYEASEIPAFYVPLTVESEADEGQSPRVFKPLTTFVDGWLDEPGRNHLSILGDFGSGKTWFCQRYAYLAAKRYLADLAHGRIPILITLRDYSRAYDVEQLITDAIANRYKVGLAAGYKTFARLNEAGRLLIIFDGFDEMERRVSDYRTTVENFWELASVVCPASKVFLTCRTAYFRHRGEEEKTLTPRHSLVSVAAGGQVIDLHGREHFEVVYLLDFDDGDIRLALQKRLPARWKPVYQKTQELSNLRDLSRRPVLLDMIVKTLPQIQNASQINQATLYEAYVDALLERRWSEDTDYIPPQERLFFIQELAWEMYETQKLTIPFSEFPERVTMYFGLKDDPERATFFERDVRTQSYLVRDDAGNYRFAHKSFMEYSVARKMAEAVSGSSFDVKKAIEVWRTQPLTPEVRDFLLPMVTDPVPLWRLVKATQGKAMSDVGYAGGNAATLLRWKGESFAGAQLALAVLAGADLFNTDLRGTDLEGTCLYQGTLSGCTLVGTNLCEADLTDVHMEEMEGVRSVSWSPDGRLLISGGRDAITRVWDTMNWNEVASLRGHRGAVRTTCWSPDGQMFASAGHDWKINIWYRTDYSLAATLPVDGKVNALIFSPNGDQLAVTVDNKIVIWDVSSWQSSSSPDFHTRRVYCLCYSYDGKYMVSGGWDKMVGIWRIQGSELVLDKSWKAHSHNVISVSYSADDRFLLTGSDDNTLRLWELETGTSKVLIKHDSPIRGLYSPDGKHVAAGSWAPNSRIWLINAITHQENWNIDAHSENIISLCFSPDSRRLATGSEDATIRIWDIDPDSSDFGKCLKILKVKMDCKEMHIGGAKGLDAPAPDDQGTLRDWLIARGAVEQ